MPCTPLSFPVAVTVFVPEKDCRHIHLSIRHPAAARMLVSQLHGPCNRTVLTLGIPLSRAYCIVHAMLALLLLEYKSCQPHFCHMTM